MHQCCKTNRPLKNNVMTTIATKAKILNRNFSLTTKTPILMMRTKRCKITGFTTTRFLPDTPTFTRSQTRHFSKHLLPRKHHHPQRPHQNRPNGNLTNPEISICRIATHPSSRKLDSPNKRASNCPRTSTLSTGNWRTCSACWKKNSHPKHNCCKSWN